MMTPFDAAAPAREEMSASRRRVLVALPGAGAAHAVIEAGQVIARALGLPLHAALVWPTPISPCQVARLLGLAPQALEGLVLHVAVGDPVERLDALARTEPVAFLVIGAESHGGGLGGLGELAARTLATTRAGVIVVRSGTSLGKLRRILVPIDGTPSTAAALCPLAELAARAGAGLDLVMIEDVASLRSDEPGAMAPPRYLDQPQHEWPAFSAELVQRLLGALAHCPVGVPTRVLLAAGRPAAEILRLGRELDTDLLALVWHGSCAGVEGAVFREVLEGAAWPVLVLRR